MALKKETQKKETKKQDVTIDYDVTVTRAKEVKGSYAFDMEVNGVKIYGCWLKEGKNGNFVSFPSYKGSDGKYYSHCYFPISDDLESDIEDRIDAML